MTDSSLKDAIGRVVPVELQEEMQRSYLEYAMSVIVGRALPDVRDGLKPVHRRILYAMHELGLTPDRPFRKCARVVGDVLGKYHPHGDQAVYDALVRMVQTFSSRFPMLDGHGNFGSVDADPPAAMRYTECRLAPVGDACLLDQVGEAIVDFVPNFDGSQLEPTVLPARLPMLLLNGSDGIAVGMATKIPPHNLGEVVDALLLTIDRPDVPLEKLLKKLPGPDFPTGGEIVNGNELADVYRKGRGAIALRGVASFEEVHHGKGKHRRTAIVITEFPYQVNKAAWMAKVADMVNHGRLSGISDLRDESDRDGIRMVVELKKDARPEIVLNLLYKHTTLQTNFGAILLALRDSEPHQFSLKELLQDFLDFRIETLTRIFNQQLDRDRDRLEELEAMLMALEHLDETIDCLRNAPDGSTAKIQLQDLLECSPNQADTILAMPFRRITGLERDRLENERSEVAAKIAELEVLLNERDRLLDYLKKELRSLKKTYNNPRRTAFADAEVTPDLEEADLIPNAPAIVQVTQKGYVRRLQPAAFDRQAKASQGIQTDVEDFVLQAQATELHQDFLALTETGKAFSRKVHEIPATTGRSRGTPLVALLPTRDPVATTVTLADYPEGTDWVLLTRQGRVKRFPLAECTNLTARGLTVLKVKDDDALGWAVLCDAPVSASVAIATSAGRVLRLPLVDQVPVMGRTAIGNQALRLRRKESIVGMVVVQA
ncbi:MAG: DNA topoisomerase (ATP-hydrolyzing), partial [Cyanobacteria bacterium J06639_1]